MVLFLPFLDTWAPWMLPVSVLKRRDRRWRMEEAGAEDMHATWLQAGFMAVQLLVAVQ